MNSFDAICNRITQTHSTCHRYHHRQHHYTVSATLSVSYKTLKCYKHGWTTSIDAVKSLADPFKTSPQKKKQRN